jgi:hypothetical protein
MVSPSTTFLLSPPIAGWRLPVLGLLLTGLGVILLYAGVRDLISPARPASSTANSLAAVEAPDRVASAALPGGTVSSAAGPALRAAPGQSRQPANCLGADLATSQRAESAHLATVALLRPVECGDLRDVIKVMAALPHTSHTTDADSQVINVAAVDFQADSIDLSAAALYGPPDRLPQATLEAKTRDRGRGRARGYLEVTTALRLLAPG